VALLKVYGNVQNARDRSDIYMLHYFIHKPYYYADNCYNFSNHYSFPWTYSRHS